MDAGIILTEYQKYWRIRERAIARMGSVHRRPVLIFGGQAGQLSARPIRPKERLAAAFGDHNRPMLFLSEKISSLLHQQVVEPIGIVAHLCSVEGLAGIVRHLNRRKSTKNSDKLGNNNEISRVKIGQNRVCRRHRPDMVVTIDAVTVNTELTKFRL
jgi:hypothetical protein